MTKWLRNRRTLQFSFGKWYQGVSNSNWLPAVAGPPVVDTEDTIKKEFWTQNLIDKELLLITRIMAF